MTNQIQSPEITVDDILALLLPPGRTSLSPLQACDLPIDARYLLRLLLREDYIPAKWLRLLACHWAERVLHLFEREYPADGRPRRCIDTARRYALGTATWQELEVAWNAAWAAMDALEADREVAWEAWTAALAVSQTAVAGAGDAAREAGWTAVAGGVAEPEQLADVRRVLAGDTDWLLHEKELDR